MKRTCCFTDCKTRCAIIFGDCKFCNNSFCGGHRLPEQHVCENYNECKSSAFEKNKKIVVNGKCENSKVILIE